MSNALYDAALKAGFEIVERHGHSRVLPGAMAEAGRDATIFWNYVDLRFRPAFDVQMEVVLGRGELVPGVVDHGQIILDGNHTIGCVGHAAGTGGAGDFAIFECFIPLGQALAGNPQMVTDRLQ